MARKYGNCTPFNKVPSAVFGTSAASMINCSLLTSSAGSRDSLDEFISIAPAKSEEVSSEIS